MRRREHFWCLYHSPEKNQLDDLRTDQIEAIFAALPKAQHGEWLIWKEGFTEWKPFSDFPQLLMSLRRAPEKKSAPPPLPKSGQSSEDSDDGVDFSKVGKNIAVVDEPIPENVQLAIESKGASDDRGRARYPKKFEVHIDVGDKVFKTSTVNISINGMRVRDPLPPRLPMYFNVEIRTKDHVIPLICSEVKGTSGSPSTILKIEANDHPEMLQTLLLTVG